MYFPSSSSLFELKINYFVFAIYFRYFVTTLGDFFREIYCFQQLLNLIYFTLFKKRREIKNFFVKKKNIPENKINIK